MALPLNSSATENAPATQAIAATSPPSLKASPFFFFPSCTTSLPHRPTPVAPRLLLSVASQTVDLAELPASHNCPLEVVAVGSLKVEGTIVLIRVPMERAEDVVTTAGYAGVAHLKVQVRRRQQARDTGACPREGVTSIVSIRVHCQKTGQTWAIYLHQK